MYSLYPYQLQAENEILSLFSEGFKRVILCSPTGSGKTVTFSDIALRAIQKGKTVMILCDRTELIGQAKEKLNALQLFPTIIAPGFRHQDNLAYLASVDTLRRRPMPFVDVLIVDEAHKQTFDSTILRYIEFCDPYVIGATATPVRVGSQNCLSTIYQKMVDVIDIPDLIEQGFLCPARTFAAKDGDMNDIKVRGNDFDAKALFDKFNQTVMYDGLIENYKKFSHRKKTICFNVDRETSKASTDKFKSEGFSSTHIDGSTPIFQRREILKDFKEGKIEVLNNCGVLCAGYDEPSIETVIVNRATLSLALFLQMVGRGSRLFKGKNHFTFIDQGANVYRHGLWEQPRTWSLYKKPKRDGDGVAPVKICLSCDAINYASARVCKECSSPFEIKEKKMKQSEFIEVTGLKRGTTAKFDTSKASLKELQNYAKERGYKSGWAWKQHELNQGKM